MKGAKHSNGELVLTVPEDVEVKKILVNDKDYIRNPFSIIAESFNRVAGQLKNVVANMKEGTE